MDIVFGLAACCTIATFALQASYSVYKIIWKKKMKK